MWSLKSAEMNNERIYAIDALRAIAMFLGVVLHATVAYQANPIREGWPVDQNAEHIYFDYLYLYIHSFRMPLFFLIAGFFCKLLYDKVGVVEFTKRRITRIVVPFLFGIILILPISVYPFLFYQNYFHNTDLLGTFLSSFADVLQWHGLLHLWFLYYLIIYYGLTILLREYIVKSKLRTMSMGGGAQIAVFCLVTWIISISFFEGIIKAWTGLIVHPGPLLYYGTFFLAGYIMYSKKDKIFFGKRLSWLYFACGSICCFIHIFLINGNVSVSNSVEKLTISLATVFLIFGYLGLFINYLNNKSFVFLYLSDSAYWIYLIHFPLVVTFQILFIGVTVTSFIKFFTVIILSYAIGLITYHKFVRYTFLGVILHGSRTKQDLKTVKAKSI